MTQAGCEPAGAWLLPPYAQGAWRKERVHQVSIAMIATMMMSPMIPLGIQIFMGASFIVCAHGSGHCSPA